MDVLFGLQESYRSVLRGANGFFSDGTIELLDAV